MAPAQGACKVMCFHPWSDMTLPLMELADIRKVVDTWVEINQDLGKKFTWVQVLCLLCAFYALLIILAFCAALNLKHTLLSETSEELSFQKTHGAINAYSECFLSTNV